MGIDEILDMIDELLEKSWNLPLASNRSVKETSNSGLVSNVCYYIVKVILLRPHVNQKDAAHSFSFSRKNHLFFSVPKISELLKPSRIKESVYWGEETMEQIKKRIAGIY